MIKMMATPRDCLMMFSGVVRDESKQAAGIRRLVDVKDSIIEDV